MVRQTVDLIVVLCLGVLLFRTFSAEAYVVPTGSMAPTLLGHHRELTCPNCSFVFVVGIDEEGQSAAGGLSQLRQERPRSAAGGGVQRRPGPGPEVPLRFPPPAALGGGGLPLSRRAVPGLREARGGPARRVGPDRRRERLDRRPDRPEEPGRAPRPCRSWCTTAATRPRDSDRYPAVVLPQGLAESPARHRLAAHATAGFVHEPVEPAGAASSPMTGWSTGTGTRC